MLGLMEASLDVRCQFRGLLLGSQCEKTAKACCGRSPTDEVNGKDLKNLELCILTSSSLSYRVCGTAVSGGI